MQEELLNQLEKWHEEDEFEQIVDAIKEILAVDRDYVLNSHLGRALNNLERYDEAVEQFLTIAEEGKDDPLWHYRIGLAYYYLERYEDALRAFEMADKLEPGDEDTLEFLEDIRSKMPQPEPSAEPASVEPQAQPEQAPRSATSAADLDPTGFWEDSAEALEQYVFSPPTEELIDAVQESLVFKLPASYIDMMKQHNGGIPRKRYFPTGEGAYVEISSILGIGREKRKSLCGEAGSRAIIENGDFPEFGVVICECPSASEVVMLDYRPAGNDGEPEVVHVDKSKNQQVTKLATSFGAFIHGLVEEKA
ncbi:cell wall assembly protein [Paenibacillus sp. CAA11]|uniref:SMI1/KNR4 family protein n=1 Tax=Paenibacillus sp. CAA11 TaxID=1532905 RepID=UPI000D3BCD0A|nr:SMI1/KNR4 family protein [Paenibacillus sp. CAA11]AWB46572.1 cell wall assembly protein [Paenibacillus sp. CAA11]